MKSYKYVEEYIEVIAGIRDPVTNKMSPSFMSTSPLSLARYDVNFINSIGDQVTNNVGLTDRQADLALKLINKYEKQLVKLEVDISPISSPVFRQAIRQLDRSKRLWLEEHLLLKFPYIEELVQQTKEVSKDSHGWVKFDRDRRLWSLALTEFNLNWAIEFARSNEFEIDPEVLELMDTVLECEKTKYEIKLTIQDNQLVITNAAPELLEYIDTHLDGLNVENIDKLVDHSTILGYDVDDSLENIMIGRYSPRIYNLMVNRDSKLDTSQVEQSFEDVVSYATATNRWPIYLYEPSLNDNLLALAQKYFTDEQVFSIGKELKHWTNTELHNYAVVHFTKYHSSNKNRIPLLVSTNGMLFGGDKQLLLTQAEKVVYFAVEVYNNISRGARQVAGNN